MRFRAADGSTVHLSYCTNVHPAESLDGVVEQLRRYAGPVRAALGVPRLGVGLWLSAAALPLDVGVLRQVLDEQGLEVTTLNGFPYGGFHDPVVKHAVYRPDWTTDARADHTLQLAEVLARLLPDDVTDGTISTLPLGYRDPWTPQMQAAAVAQLRRVGDGLTELEARTGKRITLAVEPEPACVLETTAEVAGLLDEVAHPRVGMCLDAAHFAVQWEDPAVVRPAAKLQVAVALESSDRGLLAAHDEPRFLHQVRPCSGGGTDDLPEALAADLPLPWRVHVHLPVHRSEASTQQVLRDVLVAAVGGPVPLTRSLEVETYTWSVLPGEQVDLVDGLAAELQWTRDALRSLGLQET